MRRFENTCILMPSMGYNTLSYCGKEITEDTLYPMDLSTAFAECERPEDHRTVCTKCRTYIASQFNKFDPEDSKND